MNVNDTIVAQATPCGIGGVGILRVSGIKAGEVSQAVLGRVLKPRYAHYLPFKDADGSMLDKGIALWFPNPRSFTGEDILELHGHGGSFILNLLLKRIVALPGVRIALPGEFLERAFLNNKIDLVQAEAVADLIQANSEQAARSALNSMQGLFSIRINILIESIINLRTYVETAIDFPDEKLTLSESKIKKQLHTIINDINDVLKKANQGSLLREGIKIVITGRPNAGKSSLLNILACREVAIVTDIAGTTRDVLHEHLYIDGIPFHVIDTAGLCETNNKVERIGIERALKEITHADHLLFVVDATTNKNNNIDSTIWPNFKKHILHNIPHITIVRNKVDITGETTGLTKINNHHSIIRLSAITGEGIEDLRHHLKQTMGFTYNNSEGNFLARNRHLESLKKAAGYLRKSKEQLLNISTWELLAEELRQAQLSLSQITGAFTSEDLLERIFSSFCIGK